MRQDPPLADAAERVRALDTTRSFLVQAPAGAGKTELLVRRYLRLLAQVDEPEEILAVTFTRKAAAEMRRRIVGALALTSSEDAAPDRPVDGALHALVTAVRARDAFKGWQLSAHPARLRISTIDALNGSLAGSAPVSGGASALRPVATHPGILYRKAARATLRLLVDPDGPGEQVANLLRHLDNEVSKAEEFLAQLLARRDQWLPFLGAGLDTGAARGALEAGLARLIGEHLTRMTRSITPTDGTELNALVRATRLNQGKDGEPVPEGGLIWWRCATQIVLTGGGAWRQRLTAAHGFPADQKPLKARALALVRALEKTDGLLALFRGMQTLPPPHYTDTQWHALEALLTLLPFAAAELKLVFAAEGQTDYGEIAAEARAALGDETGPSALALRVDWRVQHLLLDEFQDTSLAQYALLRALTRGWSPGDGRTLFLVGDPMQSIYRFRQAEVRLFLEVRDHGLPGILLEFVRLQANFRSVPALVALANTSFSTLFPPGDEPRTGAIAFSPSVPVRGPPDTPDSGFTLHASPWHQPDEEAAQVCRVVSAHLASNPVGSIGILVRSRRQAAPIVAALRAARVPLVASDLVTLGTTALATDVLTVTRALVHTGDRLAWLTVFRTPWCGLSLKDLAILGQMGGKASLYDQACRACQSIPYSRSVRDPVTPLLSDEGRERVSRVLDAFTAGFSRLGQVPLREVVEGVWLELGGPVLAAGDLSLVDLILDEVGRLDVGGDCPDTLALARALDRTRVSWSDPGARVQVMTIHKAKGLEFHTVILPGLGRGIRREDRPALLWQELTQGGAVDLLLAPIQASGAVEDPWYARLWDLKTQQSAAETDRLLYVAVTRARDHVHLFGQTRPPRTGDGVEARPAAGSLLERLWPALGGLWPDSQLRAPEAPMPSLAGGAVDHLWRPPVLRRLPRHWQRPPPVPGQAGPVRVEESPPVTPVIYHWANEWTRQAGTLAHRWLQQIAREGLEQYPLARLATLESQCRQLLRRQGVEALLIERAVERVMGVLKGMLTDPAGRWILSGEHRETLNEYGLTVLDGSRFRHLTVDRAFVAGDGVRWIIDYKTSSHEGFDLDAFIHSETRRYAAQLGAYRKAFASLETRTLITALYFPLLKKLVQVPPEPGALQPASPT